ncbi:MAG: hypothetical protein PHY73_02040 [Candidatus Omnitrophica bacterium]|nr:hypothetical protein [Candidatus Omnitrophota bacterium]
MFIDFTDRNKVRELRKKIENYEFVSQADFEFWKRNDNPAISLKTSERYYEEDGFRCRAYETYEDYLREHSKSPEQRAAEKKELDDIFNSPAVKEIMKNVGEDFLKGMSDPNSPQWKERKAKEKAKQREANRKLLRICGAAVIFSVIILLFMKISSLLVK